MNIYPTFLEPVILSMASSYGEWLFLYSDDRVHVNHGITYFAARINGSRVEWLIESQAIPYGKPYGKQVSTMMRIGDLGGIIEVHQFQMIYLIYEELDY